MTSTFVKNVECNAMPWEKFRTIVPALILHLDSNHLSNHHPGSGGRQGTGAGPFGSPVTSERRSRFWDTRRDSCPVWARKQLKTG